MRILLLTLALLVFAACRLPKGPTEDDLIRARMEYYTASSLTDAELRMKQWIRIDGRPASWRPSGPKVSTARELEHDAYRILDHEGRVLDLFARETAPPDEYGPIFAYVTLRQPASRNTLQKLNRRGLRVGGRMATQTYPTVGSRQSLRELLGSADVLGLLIRPRAMRHDADLGEGLESAWTVRVPGDDPSLYFAAIDALGGHRLPNRNFDPVVRIYPKSVDLAVLLDQPWVLYVARESSDADVRDSFTVPGGDSIQELITTYTVDGDNREALALDVRNAARRRGLPGNAVGLTKLEWRYEFEMRRFSDGYGVVSLQIQGTSEITVPAWRPPRGVEANLLDRWNEFAERVMDHELEHQRINEEMIVAFRQRITKIEPQPTPEDLERAVNQLAAEVDREYRVQHALFHRTDRLWAAPDALFDD